MAEIAGLVAAALTDLGHDVVFPAGGLPEKGLNRVNLVVAPHEFFPLQQGVSEAHLLAAAETCVTLGVEQPETLWFDIGARYSSVAQAVLDINRVAVDELNRRGIPASQLQLGYHSTLDHWGGDPVQRSTDVVFLGSVAPRRERLLSAMAPLLWDFNLDLRLFEFPRPMTVPRGHFVAGSDKLQLLADCRILLNIHRGEVGYFEWIRNLEAVCNGCLVLTETSEDYGPLVPGEHLLAVPAGYLGAYAASLASDEPLRFEIAQAAYDFVRTKLEMTSLLEPLCDEMQSAQQAPRGPRVPHAVVVEPVSVPAPRPLIADVLASESRIRARVKELLDSETRLIRTVEEMQSQLTFGDSDYAETWQSEAWDDFEPETTVIVTTYNSQGFVGRAVSSVFASSGSPIDLVVVDDHSTDGTVDTLKDLMESFPAFPFRIISRAANSGVSVARNIALAAARGRYVFVLDADNCVYPNAITRLADALNEDAEAAFAYGIIVTDPPGELISRLAWDLPRMCESNYVDAMASIRRSVFDEVGGYDLHFGLVGWEDYELWLRLAAAGHRPVFIPTFIGEYSVRPGSRQDTVNLDNPALFAELRRLFDFLPWP